MKYSFSIVSHKSEHHLKNLLRDLSDRLPPQSEVILTINTPEDESYLDNAAALPLKIIRNPKQLGFGANHNQAFAISSGDKFIIVNPDVRMQSDPCFLLDKAFDSGVGACAPSILSPSGIIEDSVRRFPTIVRLLKRVVLGIRRPDYIAPDNLSPVVVEWVAGMFIMFDSASFREVGGFDENYFMYLEDVDICRRLVAAGKKVLWVPSCSVVHDAQRASRNNWQHRRWHVRSLVRFFFRV
jgi:N-acetylglucosaminyl-diphospho-decaprenol L-rhamnosyltransferase